MFAPLIQITSAVRMSATGTGRAIDPERLLVGRTGADHAQPPVVVDVRGSETHARELAHQVGFLGRQARAGEHGEGVAAVLRLHTRDLAGDTLDRLSVGHGAEAARRRWITPVGSQQPVGVCALQVAFYALRTQLALVERKLHPWLEADHLVVFHQQLDAALLAAEAAVGLDDAIRCAARIEPLAAGAAKVRAEPLNDLGRIDL